MPKLTFFRQMRMDGGIRSGLEYDGAVILEHFEPGADESDAALKWYMDARCVGPKLIFHEREPARQWMLDRKDILAPALVHLAQELKGAGIDIFLPLHRALPAPAPGVKANLIVSGMRRQDALRIGNDVREFGQRWEDLLRSLEPV